MAGKLYDSPLLIGKSYNMKIPKVYQNRRSRFPRMENFTDRFNHYVKRQAYKILVIVMLITLSIGILPSLFGCRFESIRSGSMSPALDTGSLVITRPVNPYSIEVGDVIAYYPPSNSDTLIVHRVAGIENGSPLSFRTKGDANNSLDAYLLPAEAVVGQVRFHIPLIGYLVGFAQSFTGFIILLALPGMIVVYLELSKLWSIIDSKRTNKKWQKINPYLYTGRKANIPLQREHV